MSDTTQTVQSYIPMWNETDAHERRELVAQTVTEDASLLVTDAGSGVSSVVCNGVPGTLTDSRFECPIGLTIRPGG